ncbi:hypothetical protein B0T10DRAFT_464922 [Thelonectria olida]|uniref:Uncharacterized protein n=1 Tax=Thelonectria olida TaxID=1576542 RepID=A0A9P8VT15_9HYPO|nr:hypothetical protein B0T10DRAFT_464922 [Thelonectria olida]
MDGNGEETQAVPEQLCHSDVRNQQDAVISGSRNMQALFRPILPRVTQEEDVCEERTAGAGDAGESSPNRSREFERASGTVKGRRRQAGRLMNTPRYGSVANSPLLFRPIRPRETECQEADERRSTDPGDAGERSADSGPPLFHRHFLPKERRDGDDEEIVVAVAPGERRPGRQLTKLRHRHEDVGPQFMRPIQPKETKDAAENPSWDPKAEKTGVAGRRPGERVALIGGGICCEGETVQRADVVFARTARAKGVDRARFLPGLPRCEHLADTDLHVVLP